MEPDEFYLNLPSGKSLVFIFNKQKEIITFPDSKIIIIPKFENGSLNRWEVTDLDGTIYYFKSGNRINRRTNFSHSSNGDLAVSNSDNISFITNWILDKVITTAGEVYEYNYNEKYIEECQLVNQTRQVREPALYNESFKLGNYVNNISTNFVNTLGVDYYLHSIEGSFGKLIFETIDERLDNPNAERLDVLKLINKDGKLIHKVNFFYDYMISNSPQNEIYACNNLVNSEIISKRLILNKIRIDDYEEFKFNYNPETLPHRFSYSRDWWGYYNGSNNAVLVSTAKWQTNLSTPYRNVNEEYSKAGILESIQNPSKGRTEYVFESNRGLYNHFYNDNIIPSINTNFFFNNRNSELSHSDGATNQTYFYSKQIILERLSDVIWNSQDNQYYVRLKYDSSSTSCNYTSHGGNSLPLEGSCSIWIKLFVDGEENPLMVKLLGADRNGSIDIPLGSDIPEYTNLRLDVEIFEGNNSLSGNQTFNIHTDEVQFNLRWRLYDGSVKKIGNSYEIPIGGLRIKVL
ncbi:hypothetical protein GO491_11100 [Flavobacteriaceae bacterium Ap0902]|nr:hypothetical protein [Flavobacteriaceae bacterium Ap0902]